MSKIAIAYPMFKTYFERNFNQEIHSLKREDSVEDFDLIVFSGGEDINPEIYGEKNRYSTYNSLRDKIELYWLEKCIQSSRKILGVCRGHQLINAYLGGKLVQDLIEDLRQHHTYYHELIFTIQQSIVSNFFFDDVNSMHHQGVIKEGKGLITTSYHNGVIESCESNNIITVQFHPEFMYSTDFFKYLEEEWITL